MLAAEEGSIQEVPFARAAVAFRKFLRLGKHSDGNIGTPFTEELMPWFWSNAQNILRISRWSKRGRSRK